jgi:hypothetical protein
MRLIACAGALAIGLVLGGPGAGLATADPGESASGAEGGATASGTVESNSDGDPGTASKPDNDPPTSTVGSGREDKDPKRAEKQAEEQEEKKPAPGVRTWPRFRRSISVPVLRVPTPEEVAATGWSDPSIFWGTVEVPTLGGFLSAFSQPEPTPTPGPAFRGKEEAPVIDVDGGGGGGHALATDNGGPPVIELPLVAVPTVPIPGIRVPAMPLGASAAGGSPQATGASTAAAGVQAPVIRGTLSSAGTQRTATLSSPTSGQGTPTGYPRFLRSPTVAELAAVALPGVAGLLFLTFGGGVIGYRQANSSRYLRTAGAERFLE